jgi:transposase
MLAARNVIRTEIKRLLRALRGQDSPLTGKARDQALQRLRELRLRERGVIKTASQRLAARIAQFARRNGAGRWQITDWGKGKRAPAEEPWLARNWALGAVLDALRWQARQLGLPEPLKVDPALSSERCSKCGHLSRANRPQNQGGRAKFHCEKCGHEENADKNAARNLSLRGIDQLLREAHAARGGG